MTFSSSWDHASERYQSSRSVTIRETNPQSELEQYIAEYREQLEILETALNVPDYTVSIDVIVQEVLRMRDLIDSVTLNNPLEQGQVRAIQYCDERLRKIRSEIEQEIIRLRQNSTPNTRSQQTNWWWIS